MLETEKFINSVLAECVRLDSFNANNLFAKFVAESLSGEDRYYQQRDVTNALGFLEQKRFTSGETRPEFTEGLKLLKEVRYGKPTTVGRVAVRLPKYLRLSVFWILLQWKRLTSILASLGFLKLAFNALGSLQLLAGWLDRLIFIVIAWAIYALIMRGLK